jgi:hypothetical protein
MEFNEGLAKLEARAKIATIVLWVFAAVSVLTAGCELLEASGMIDIETGSGMLVLAAGLVYLAYTATFIASVVVVAMWIHRAHANLHDAGVDGLEFTPGWAVGWYFIPFANLFKPFQSMRELWTASHGENNQFAGETPSEVKTWWAAWIIGNILSTVSARILLMGEGGANSVMVGNAVGVAGTAVIVLAAVLLVKVIEGVTQAQRGGSTAVGVFA